MATEPLYLSVDALMNYVGAYHTIAVDYAG
jgi:hypothetical protein